MIEGLKPLKKYSRYHAWRDFNVADIKAFIAIEMTMGMVKKPTIQSYWADNFWPTQTPGFAQIMTMNDYLLIRSALHFADNDTAEKDNKLYKIQPVLDIVKPLYSQLFVPGMELSVDETIVKFHGKARFKQYNAKKPTKWGIKLWSLADAKTGYLIKFEIYLGAQVDIPKTEMGLGGGVVLDILEGYKHLGHHVYMDNYYSSIPLYRALRKVDVGACGTVDVRRRFLPNSLKTIKLKKGDLPAVWVENNELLACTWQDTGRVNQLSTIGDTGVTRRPVKNKTGKRYIDKPNCNILYNEFMGGVDVFDHLCTTYKFMRRTHKWYRTIWYFVQQAALINARILFNFPNPVKKKHITADKFMKAVVEGLLLDYSRQPLENRRGRKRSLDISVAYRFHERHYPSENKPDANGKKRRPDCVVCSIRCKLKGKAVCKRHQTNFYCRKCVNKPALCITNADDNKCFEFYHEYKQAKLTCKCLE